jgi:hypothetical protein
LINLFREFRAPALLSAVTLCSWLACSCVLPKALYLGEDVYSGRTGPRSADAPYEAGDVNGIFPKAVYIKTRSQTFNLYHYYILRDGLIWHKSLDGINGPANWTLFQKTGLPHNPRKPGFNKPARIVEISADADELAALSEEGGFYRYCFDKTIAHKSNVWLDRQGWPNAEQLFFDRRTSKNLSWALGKRNAHVLYYEDPFGNQHHNGTMEIATTYVLLADGQEICYSDTGLPSDFSRNYLGPERGAFKAVALSASASTMFVINRAGKMYTRLADFDTAGGDPMLFKYTYIPYKSDLPGTDYFSNLNEWGLPSEDWRLQPPIPLSEKAGSKAAITRHITILQNGQGNAARELRVAGLNEAGETGYWTKAIFDDAWEFRAVPLYFGEESILKTAAPVDPVDSDLEAETGLSMDAYYSGYFWQGEKKEQEWEYAIPNFNLLEGDCDLQINWRGETCTLKLHPVELWTYVKRNYLPGRTGSPKMFLVTLEIPENAFDGLSEYFAAQLARKYVKNDRKLFRYTIAASDRYIFMWRTGSAESTLFLTNGEISDYYPEFPRIQFVDQFEELRRYQSPELSLDGQVTPGRETLFRKIELNKALYDELKYQIRALKWAQLTALNFNLSYLPAHYIARFTPLRFVDVPKIRTITTFGSEIILANSSYISNISNIRIWLYEKIIELLEMRLLHCRELEKEQTETWSNPSGAAKTPSASRYSENIADYWDGAGLPSLVSGAFFGPETRPRRTRPAVLSFLRNETEPEIFGWRFSIGESAASAAENQGFSIFVDPLKSLQTIYSRRGKNPKEKPIQLDCVLYLNTAANSPVEKDIINRMLAPFIKENDQGIKARIRFDGKDFEIRQYPAEHKNSLIFRGELYQAPAD